MKAGIITMIFNADLTPEELNCEFENIKDSLRRITGKRVHGRIEKEKSTHVHLAIEDMSMYTSEGDYDMAIKYIDKD